MIDRDLFDAALNEDFSKLESLVQKGYDLNAIDELTGETLLYKMISFDHEKIANYLVDLGANIHISNHTGKTILMEAASRGLSNKFIKKLIQHGADVEKTDDFGGNVLWWTENKSTFEYLKSIGLQIKKKISYIQSNNEYFEDYFIVRKSAGTF